MTKPIEGWMSVTADREVSVYTDIEDPRSDHIAIYLRKQPGLDYRPVQITFTDEVNTGISEKEIDGLAHQYCYGRKFEEDCQYSNQHDQVAFVAGYKMGATRSIEDAISKERERILDDLSGIISTSETTTMEEVREIIFGEEK